MNNEEYIQLPPFRKDTEGAAVQMIWEYVRLPEEAQKEVYEDLLRITEKPEKRDYVKPQKYRNVTREEIADYEEAVNNLIRSLVVEASDIACWVFAKKYIDGWSIEQMIEEMPMAEKFIIVMDTMFEKIIQGQEPTGFEN